MYAKDFLKLHLPTNKCYIILHSYKSIITYYLHWISNWHFRLNIFQNKFSVTSFPSLVLVIDNPSPFFQYLFQHMWPHPLKFFAFSFNLQPILWGNLLFLPFKIYPKFKHLSPPTATAAEQDLEGFRHWSLSEPPLFLTGKTPVSMTFP